MATLTASPAIFDPDDDATLSPNSPIFGPSIGSDGAWSEVIAEPGQPGYHIVERTPSGGPPWISQDDGSSNRPPNAIGGIDSGATATSTHIYVVNYDSSDTYFRAYTFDRSLKTWGTPSASSDTQYATYIPVAIRCLSDGSLIVLSYFNGFPVDTNLYYHKINSGVWGSRQLLTTGVTRGLLRVGIDASDRLHIFHAEDNSSSPIKIHYLQFDAVGETITVSDSLIYTASGAGIWNTENVSDVLIDDANDKVYWFITPRGYGSASDHIPRLIVGDGLTAPSFSVESPDSGLLSITDTTTHDPKMRVYLGLDANGDVLTVWCVAYGSGPGGVYTNVEAWTNSRTTGGSWGTPLLLYDAVGNPGPDFSYPVDYSYYDPIHYVNVLKPSLSDWVFQFGYQMGGSPYTDKTYIIESIISSRNNYVSAGGPMVSRGNYASA